MNKEVISISNEDDITDIISRLKASEKKIVAIVPPKPAGILRSAVNIKLIAKTAEEAEKVVVIVTADPALIKLASEIRLPVAENLTSRPHVPTAEDLEKLVPGEDDEDEDEVAEEFTSPVKSAGKLVDDDEDEEEKPRKKDSKSAKKSKGKKKPLLSNKVKIIIASVVLVLLIASALVYFLVVAPSAEVHVAISSGNRTNFTKPITMTDKQSEENIESGKFFLNETKKEQSPTRVNFEATGKKDNGDKATGELEVSIYFDITGDEASTVKILSGTEFSIGDLVYKSTKDVIYTYDIEETTCENDDTLKVLKRDGCMITKTVNISASEPGEKYNIKELSSDWKAGISAPVAVKDIVATNIEEISGGTSKIVAVVLQSDVDLAKNALSSTSDEEGRNLLKSSISDSNLIIDSTFKASEPTFKVTPAVGEEVKDGVKPVLEATREFSIKSIDKAKIEEFVKDNLEVADDQMIYTYGEPYIDFFRESDNGNGYTGTLKTTAQTGPNITEDIIREKVLGRKVGDALSQLRSITGIDSNKTTINTSFLVNTIPSDKERVTITIEKE